MGQNNHDADYEFAINKADITDREDFGVFEVVFTKTAKAWFRTYTGFNVITPQFSVGIDGKAKDTSLYGWLKTLTDFKRSIIGKENESIVGNESITNAELLESMKITTIANLVRPTTVFTDYSLAIEEASRYQNWLVDAMDKLEKTINSEPTDEDYKANAEFDAKVEKMETLKDMFVSNKNE